MLYILIMGPSYWYLKDHFMLQILDLFYFLFFIYERDKEGMEYEYDSTMHALNLMPTFAHMKNYIYIENLKKIDTI